LAVVALALSTPQLTPEHAASFLRIVGFA